VYPGLLISFEGIDCAGKTSLLSRLAHDLQQDGYQVFITKEPGGTRIGKMLKKVLLEEEKQCNPRVEFLLFAADRAEHFAKKIIPALQEGKIILSDRMADSALAYQGYGRNLNTTFISAVNEWAMQGVKPDLTFYLRITYETLLNRLKHRAHTHSTMEREKAPFWKRVITGFEELAKKNPAFVTIDAHHPINDVYRTARQWLYIALEQKQELAREHYTTHLLN